MHRTSPSGPVAAPSTRPPGRPLAESRATVLLGDSDEDVHTMYGAYLEHRGFVVVHARSAPDCLRLVRTRPVAAVVVSVGVRGLFFWRAYHGLAEAARSAGLALICLTTDPRLATSPARHRRCADAVLMLPCAPEALAAEIERAVREARRPPN